MKAEFIKNKKEFISAVLLGLSAVLAVCILIKVAGFFVTSVRAGTLVKKAVVQSKFDPNDSEKFLAKSRALADELKKKNLFVPPEPKKHPVKQVSGILGNEALIKGKWYKVGDKIGDAEIVAIEPVRVKIKWDGKEKYFAPIGSASAPEPKKKPRKPVKAKVKNKKMAVKKPAQDKAVAVSEPEDPLAWMGITLSASLRAKLLEMWNSLTDEQKEKFKEQWNNMSDEQKQQAVEMWEKHL